MKTIYTILFVMLALLPVMVKHINAQDEVVYYFRQSNQHPYREFKYLRLNNDIRYVNGISLKDMAENIGVSGISLTNTRGLIYSFEMTNNKGVINKYELRYYILTSQEDAELYALDLIGGSTSIYRHVKDYNIELGDNGWIDGNNQTVFLRDNVCIWLWGVVVQQEDDYLNCAKSIDNFIMKSDKADTADELQAPSIDNVDIISFSEKSYQVSGEERISYRYDLAVTAHDAKSDTLYYRTSGSSLASVTNGSIAYYSLEKEVNCKVFVMNERHLVASKDIFDTRRGDR